MAKRNPTPRSVLDAPKPTRLALPWTNQPSSRRQRMLERRATREFSRRRR